MPRRSAAAGLALVGCLAAACTGGDDDAPAPAPSPTLSQPAPEAFRAGTCRSAAPDVLLLGREAFALGNGPTAPPDVQQRIAESQTRLRELPPADDPALAPLLQELVVSTGLVRIRAVGGSLDEDVLFALREDYDALVAACTTA